VGVNTRHHRLVVHPVSSLLGHARACRRRRRRRRGRRWRLCTLHPTPTPRVNLSSLRIQPLRA
jgi:hypothetical protein